MLKNFDFLNFFDLIFNYNEKLSYVFGYLEASKLKVEKL